MNQGIIEKIIADRGFGFIRRDDTGDDIFFHATKLKDVEFKDLAKGDKVFFNIEAVGDRVNAIDVSKTDL